MPALIKTQHRQQALFCPVCGQQAHPKTDSPCAHLVYVYDDSIGSFLYVIPEVQSIVKAITQEDEANESIIQQLMDAPEGADMMMAEYRPLEHPVLRFEKKLGRKSILHLAVHALTDGDVSHILRMGFDFDKA